MVYHENKANVAVQRLKIILATTTVAFWQFAATVLLCGGNIYHAIVCKFSTS